MGKTRQREKIEAVFEEQGRPLSLEEIVLLCRPSCPRLGQSTVYRVLRALVKEGHLRKVSLPGGKPRYERSAPDELSLFQCERCARAFAVSCDLGPLEKMAPAGFRVLSYSLTLYGSCAECAQVFRSSARCPKRFDSRSSILPR